MIIKKRKKTNKKIKERKKKEWRNDGIVLVILHERPRVSARSQRVVLGTLQGVDVVERMMCQLLKGFTREEESLLEDIFLFCGKEGEDAYACTWRLHTSLHIDLHTAAS